MTHISRKITIHAPADAIWRVISNFGAAGNYLAEVVTCIVVGEGVGAQRELNIADGSTIIERLEVLDEGSRNLSYALLTDTPFRNCLTSMMVRDMGPNQSELEWSATFEADGLPASEAVELMDSAVAANCVALKKLIEH